MADLATRAALGFFATQEGQGALLGGSTVALLTIENHPARNGSARIILSTSDDAGISWQSDTTITSELPITMASIAANDKGQLGVVYNQVDLTHVDCARDLIPARTVFAVSSDRGRSWTSTLVGPAWWNFGSAGLNPIYGWWLGEFQSLTGTPNGFTTITPQGRALTPRPHPPIVGETGIVVADIHTVQGRP